MTLPSRITLTVAGLLASIGIIVVITTSYICDEALSDNNSTVSKRPALDVTAPVNVVHGIAKPLEFKSLDNDFPTPIDVPPPSVGSASQSEYKRPVIQAISIHRRPLLSPAESLQNLLKRGETMNVFATYSLLAAAGFAILSLIIEAIAFCIRKVYSWWKNRFGLKPTEVAVEKKPSVDIWCIDHACNSFNSAIKYHLAKGPNEVEKVNAPPPENLTDVVCLLKEFVERRIITVEYAKHIVDNLDQVTLCDGELCTYQSQREIAEYINAPLPVR